MPMAAGHLPARGNTMRVWSRWMLLIVAAIALMGCGDDDDGTAVDDAEEGDAEQAVDDDDLEAAMEEGAEETGADLDALDEDADGGLPDDFPDDVPVPDDHEVRVDFSGDFDEGREIYLDLATDVDGAELVELYSTELAEHYEVDTEEVGEDGDTGHWEFTGGGWLDGRVTINHDPNDEVAHLVMIILRDHEV